VIIFDRMQFLLRYLIFKCSADILLNWEWFCLTTSNFA
jgi:hypothetical protein